MADIIARRAGVKVDPAKLDYELGRRGIPARELSRRSGIAEAMISRARHGHPISESTLRRLTGGLLSIPLMVGADLLIAAPARNGEVAAAFTTAATPKDGASTNATPAP